MPFPPNHKVAEKQAEALNFANDVICKVKLAMPYGAGNQRADVLRTGGQSAVRTQLAYDAWERSRPPHRFKPKLLAGIAKTYGAGNCDMAGAMAYTLLRGSLDDRFEVMLIPNQPSGHTYAAFKYQGTEDSASIIVDPWPILPMATLEEHHFWGSLTTSKTASLENRGSGIVESRRKSGSNYRKNTMSCLL
jgi:hypothetical protein